MELLGRKRRLAGARRPVELRLQPLTPAELAYLYDQLVGLRRETKEAAVDDVADW